MSNLLIHIPTLSEIFEFLNWPQLHAVLGAIAAAIAIVVTLPKIVDLIRKPKLPTDAEIIDGIVASSKKTARAVKAILLADRIKQQLFENLCEQLRKRLRDEYEVGTAPYKSLNETNFHLFISYSTPAKRSQFQFRLQFATSQFRDCFVGIYKPKDVQIGKEQFEAFVRAFGCQPDPNCPEEDWLWWQWTSLYPRLGVENNWMQKEVNWIAIADKTLAEKIEKEFKKSQDALKTCGLG